VVRGEEGIMQSVGFGVIGVGTWGELHARVYATTPGARLAAVCDSNGDRAQQVSISVGGATVYSDYREMLRDPAVQAVSIVLPDFLHREAAVTAAQAGKHILLEKPLATTEEDALAILNAARASGVTLFVDFHNRWSPMFQSLKQAYDAGELGAPQLITYRLSDTIYVPTKMLRWAGQSTVAWFLSSHCLDTLLWLLNARRGDDAIERLTCLTRSRVLVEERGVTTPDFYLTTLEWRSGAVTMMENAWILPECGPSIFDKKCQFIGSRGAFFIDASTHRATEKQTHQVTYPDNFVLPTLNGQPAGFASESIRHFARSIIEGTKPAVDGLDGLAVTRLIVKMEESARAGLPVAVGDVYEEPAGG
jgi:predicted dehydrogenase